MTYLHIRTLIYLEQNSKVNVDLYHTGIVYAFSVSYCDHVIVCPFVCLSSDLL